MFILRVIAFITLAAALSCIGGNHDGVHIPAPPDYTDATYWFGNPFSEATADADIFYVYPTLGTHPLDAAGQPLDLTPVDRQDERDAALGNQRFNKNVYAGDQFNFFAPYYRQRTMSAYRNVDKQSGLISETPAADIADAFGHYMTHFNHGRPFILLGHSQGSEVLLKVLKGMTDRQFDRMIAAYLIGWQITQKDLDDYPARILPAQGEDDTSVVILYNSLTTPDAISPLTSATVVCINPLNWTTGSAKAPREMHMGVVRYNTAKGAYDTITHFTGANIQDYHLICTDVDPKAVFQEELAQLFPKGNLHFMDSWLYALNLKSNMLLRKEIFIRQSP